MLFVCCSCLLASLIKEIPLEVTQAAQCNVDIYIYIATGVGTATQKKDSSSCTNVMLATPTAFVLDGDPGGKCNRAPCVDAATVDSVVCYESDPSSRFKENKKANGYSVVSQAR